MISNNKSEITKVAYKNETQAHKVQIAYDPILALDLFLIKSIIVGI